MVMVSPSRRKVNRIVLQGNKGKVEWNFYINSKSIIKCYVLCSFLSICICFSFFKLHIFLFMFFKVFSNFFILFYSYFPQLTLHLRFCDIFVFLVISFLFQFSPAYEFFQSSRVVNVIKFSFLFSFSFFNVSLYWISF